MKYYMKYLFFKSRIMNLHVLYYGYQYPQVFALLLVIYTISTIYWVNQVWHQEFK